MRKILLVTALSVASLFSVAQSPLWWNLDGSNSGTATTAIGVFNYESLRFKTNGTEWMSISPTGEYFFNSLSGATEGLIGIKTDGKLNRINFTGNSFDVFRGDGTFVPVSSITGWNFDGTIVSTSYNVGIGTNLAPEKLTVDGNILANGNISGTSLTVIDIVGAGKQFKILNSYIRAWL